MVICRQRVFPLALAPSNQKLNKLLIVLKLLVQVGNLVMYRKSFVIAVLIAFPVHKRYIINPEKLNQQRLKCASQMREPLYLGSAE